MLETSAVVRYGVLSIAQILGGEYLSMIQYRAAATSVTPQRIVALAVPPCFVDLT